MKVKNDKIAEFADLVKSFSPEDGVNEDLLNNVVTFRSSKVHKRNPVVYHSGIIFCAQGRKNIYLNGCPYDYYSGTFLAMFMPMAVECEVTEASRDNPVLGLGIYLDWSRIARIILKMEQVETLREVAGEPSGIISGEIKDSMFDSIIRLLKTLSSPVESAVLGNCLLDEIYFRLLWEEKGGALKSLLQQRGQIQQISKAVEFVQHNLQETISVDDMAEVVNMSSSGFHKKFKEVMHVSPLQYVKSLKLDRAKTYILEGRNVSEAGYLVGYNSLAQFSREFKRYFGVVPSEIF